MQSVRSVARAACLAILFGVPLGCGDGAEVCVPGAQQSCPCAGGESGAQTCNADGTGFQTCACVNEDGAFGAGPGAGGSTPANEVGSSTSGPPGSGGVPNNGGGFGSGGGFSSGGGFGSGPSGFACAAELDPNCPALDAVACACAGCSADCAQSDCVCPICATDNYCSDPGTCLDDGSCDPWSEGCICADCADHPSC